MLVASSPKLISCLQSSSFFGGLGAFRPFKVIDPDGYRPDGTASFGVLHPKALVLYDVKGETTPCPSASFCAGVHH